jgi:hypothetical protein
LGDFVIEAAVQQARALTRAGFEFGHIAINLSASQLRSPAFAQQFLDRLAAFELPSRLVSVEVTDRKPRANLGFKVVTGMVRQLQLLEMAQANITFALEFSQRLATIRSPVEFFTVIAEFTSSRIAMFGKYTEELAELTFKRQA